MDRGNPAGYRLVIIDAAGRVVEDHGPTTPAEFRELARQTNEAFRERDHCREVTRTNEARLAMLLNALARAGVLRPEGRVDLSPGLRPYFDAFMVEYENRQTLRKRIDRHLANLRKRAVSWLMNQAGKLAPSLTQFLTKHG